MYSTPKYGRLFFCIYQKKTVNDFLGTKDLFTNHRSTWDWSESIECWGSWFQKRHYQRCVKWFYR